MKRLARQIDTRTQLLEAQEHEARLLAGELTLAHGPHGRQPRPRPRRRQKELYAEMVREAYRNYRHENYLTYLFASEDFADIARKIANLRQVASMRADKLRRIGDLKVEVAREREELDRRKARARLGDRATAGAACETRTRRPERQGGGPPHVETGEAAPPARRSPASSS